ncbi:MAG: response regulator, partial [Spirochaetaceae bacterium]
MNTSGNNPRTYSMLQKPKPVILCVDDERVIIESLRTELGEILGDSYVVEISESGEEALELCRDLIHEGREIPVVICDYIMPKMKGDELLAEMHILSPATKTILLTGQATTDGVTNAVNSADLYRYIAKPWEPEDLAITLREAIKSFRQELDLDQRIRELENEREKVVKERKVIDTLSKILNEKISELEIQKRELEQISRELNITTIEKILIEQEAEKMSRTLTALENSLTNNLFIRSVLHSLVNMLQIQLSVDRRENSII